MNWTFIGSLNIPRSDHTATLLFDNRVLVAGGFWDAIGFHQTAELYDSATGMWNLTGSLNADEK